MSDDDLLRRLRDHGRRLEHAADALDGVSTPASVPHRRSVATGASGLVAAAAVIAVVVAVLVAHSHSHSHESVIVAPSTSVPSACVASPTLSPEVVSSPKLAYRALPSRSGAAFAYDPATRDVVLFGGSSQATLDDTWLWDGHGWSQAHPKTSPTPRENGTMAYDPATGQLVLFGGTQDLRLHNSIAHHDTWTWDGTTWTQQHPRHVPPWSNGFTMSYDPCSRSIILITLPSHHPNITETPNVLDLKGGGPFGTWQWDGSDWRELPTQKAPQLATANAVVNDFPRLAPLPNGAGLLFYSWAVYSGSCPGGLPKGSPCNPVPDPTGTHNSQTWTWNGNRWTEQHPSRAPVAGQLVVTPGSDASPTVLASGGAVWRWTGSDWDETQAPGPATRNPENFAVYDEADNNVVFVGYVYGADTSQFGTWTWNGTWTKRSPAITPAGAHQVPPASCRTAQLAANDLWQGDARGLRGDITVHNTGPPCTLAVRDATLALISRGVALPLQSVHTGQEPHDLTARVLENQGSADLIVFWSNWCKPVPGPMRVALTLPGGGAPLTYHGGPLLRGQPLAPRCDAPQSPSGIEVSGLTAP